MHRAEISFRALHERLVYLEQRQAWQGPSDEQVERILRKILAERFADAGPQHVENPNQLKDSDYFVKRPDYNTSMLKSFPIDGAQLQVDPDAVPSKAYDQTIQMLQKDLGNFPQVDLTKSTQKSSDSDKDEAEFKRPKLPTHSNQARPL